LFVAVAARTRIILQTGDGHGHRQEVKKFAIATLGGFFIGHENNSRDSVDPRAEALPPGGRQRLLYLLSCFKIFSAALPVSWAVLVPGFAGLAGSASFAGPLRGLSPSASCSSSLRWAA